MKLLVVVDMQNDFIDGALGTPEAQAIVPAVAAKVKKYVENGDAVLYTRDTHFNNYLDTQEGRKLPVPHCIAGTKGWEIREEVYTTRYNHTIDKNTFGAWDIGGAVNRIARFYDNEFESIELIGLCTDICVISNAIILKTYFSETPISVDSSCCAGVTPESHNNALEAMKMCQIEVI